MKAEARGASVGIPACEDGPEGMTVEPKTKFEFGVAVDRPLVLFCLRELRSQNMLLPHAGPIGAQHQSVSLSVGKNA